jgi:hypothetical protein
MFLRIFKVVLVDSRPAYNRMVEYSKEFCICRVDYGLRPNPPYIPPTSRPCINIINMLLSAGFSSQGLLKDY